MFFDSLKANAKLNEIMSMVDEPDWKDTIDINNYFAEVVSLIERTI